MRRVESKRAAVAVLLVAVSGVAAFAPSRAAQESGPAATFVVNSTADAPDLNAADGLCLTAAGVCTLRAAIEQANADASADAINFLIPSSDPNCNAVSNVCTITPNSALPAVTRPAALDGYTQTLAAENTLAVGDDAQIKIELNGANAGPGADGLHLAGGNSSVRGLAVYGFQGDGVELSAAGSNTVSGNFIGHTAQGNVAGFGNVGDGVKISGVGSNTVGGATPGARNLIASNAGAGVQISGAGATGNVVAGNYVGTDRTGALDFGNTGDGVNVAGPLNLVGGPTAVPGRGAGNVMSGNAQAGVRVSAGGDSTLIQGNVVGLNAAGALALGNSGEAGVFVTGGATNVTVGGSTPDLRNVISGNAGSVNTDGVELNSAGGNRVQGNFIGTDLTGALDRGNTGDGVRIASGSVMNTVGGAASAPGAAPGNVISGNTSDGVEINTGTAAPVNNVVQGNLVGTNAAGTAPLRNDSNGLLLATTANNLVGGPAASARNVITGGLGANSDGVDLQNADSNTIAGNYIGLKPDGTGSNSSAADDFGAGQDGVRLTSDSDANVIGGAAPASGQAPANVISGHASNGVEIASANSSGNLVQGNLVGTQADGATAYANGEEGVFVNAAPSNTVGGTAAGAGNVISGNGGDGLRLAANNCTAHGNLVGVTAAGAAPLANAGHGLHVNGSTNAVGGTTAGAANTVAHNGGDGVYVASGTGNQIRRNSIYANAGLGLDLGADGVTPNDADDPDAGANGLQNFPVLTSATTGSTVITGTLNSTPSTTFAVEFFSSPSADHSAHGEGQTFLDQISVTTDGGGDAAFTHTVAAAVAPGQVITATATDPAGNTSEFSKTRQVLAPTAARLRAFRATAGAPGVLLEWQTSFEVDNLGFNLYREEGGRRESVNPSPVAGSALISDATLAAGHSYAWLDRAGTPEARYYLEDVDIGGARNLHGPFWPAPANGRWTPKPRRSPLLEQLGRPPTDTGPAQRQVLTDFDERGGATGGPSSSPGDESRPAASSAAAERQRELAAAPAVKLFVRRAGWHRVTRAELEAACLNPSADPARLQLYADGIELAIKLDEAAWRAGGGAVEFYGTGLDTPSTDTRVYWLVEGEGPGRRVGGARTAVPEGRAPSVNQPGGIVVAPPVVTELPRSFTYMTELKERLLYFSSLRNGERENFFGRVVSAGGLVQTLEVRHIDRRVEIHARLRVALQGVTNVAHAVEVELNGAPLGTFNFHGRERVVGEFLLSPSTLREGANELRLRGAGGPSDVSLTDFARLSYSRLFRAEGDRLWFPAYGGTLLRVGGFTSADIRVADVTDPLNVSELDALVEPEAGGFAATFTTPPGSGARRLMAFTGGRVETAAARANRPSALRDAEHSADYLVLTRGEFREALAPLLARRAAEGLEVKVVEVEDVFDEFSFGAHSPQAVKDFLSAARASWRKAPRFLLLAGDGSYDPRDHLGRGFADLVPVKLVDTENMEAVSDDWFADFDGDGLAELAVGRLPVRTPAEAAALASKIAGQTSQGLRQSVLLVSDRRGPDGFDFEAASDSLAGLVPEGVAVARVGRGTQTAAVVRSQITAAIGEGQTIVNYLGHGSLGVWTGEGLLRNEDAARLTNAGRPSFFVLMTCLNGHFADPALDSLGEALLKAEGGALAAWGSSAMSAPEAPAAMNRELYRLLFGTPLTLGEAVRRAKSAADDADVRRSWVLLGDPATRLR